jgi:hypothetical protein
MESEMGNLENIPACLRVIARQIEKGEIKANVGVLTLRKRGATRPTVFGFGPVGKLDPELECAKAVAELQRLSTPA